jgi:succinyl-CoA synthetase beta subunit
MEALRMVRERFPSRVVMLCVRGPEDAVRELNALGFPTAGSIDMCCATLAGLAGLAARTGRPPVAIDVPKGEPLPAEAFRHEAGAKRALAAAGVPVLPERLAQSAATAAEAAAELGFPVVLKIASPDLPHKTEVGGVALGLASAEEVATAFDAMLRRVAERAPAARIDGVLVAPMAGGGTELILGATRDPVFGPVVVAGFGGIFAEIVKDVAVRPAPVDEDEALAMLRSLKAFPLLDGARNRPRADLAAAASAIAALSRFAVAHADEVAEIDVNPLLVRADGQGAVALDALLVPHPERKDR